MSKVEVRRECKTCGEKTKQWRVLIIPLKSDGTGQLDHAASYWEYTCQECGETEEDQDYWA